MSEELRSKLLTTKLIWLIVIYLLFTSTANIKESAPLFVLFLHILSVALILASWIVYPAQAWMVFLVIGAVLFIFGTLLLYLVALDLKMRLNIFQEDMGEETQVGK